MNNYNLLRNFNYCNKANFLIKVFQGNAIDLDYKKELIKFFIDNSCFLNPVQKEFDKALVSSIRFN